MRTPLWVVAVMLAFIAGMLWSSGGSDRQALAQPTPMVGARGIYAFAGQVDRNRWGLYMLDIEQGTVWCYAFEPENATTKLRLIAGRSWIYDRYLRDFNCASPSVADIQQLVARQREARPAAEPEPPPAGGAADRDEEP